MNRLHRFATQVFSLFCIASPSLASDLDLLGSDEGDIPMVLTPTRLRQSLVDVPNSVTILTAKMMKQFGITSIPEALRLVPGMAVTQMTGHDYRINYHGTHVLVPRRMNILVDGVAIYRPGIARADWKELPIAIDDIDRIEVTRGTNSASYGTDSMLAIINIITKHPKDTDGTTLSVTSGSLGTKEGFARYGGKLGDSTSYRVSVSHQKDTGFDLLSSPSHSNGIRFNHHGHDGTRLNRFNFRSVSEISNNQTLDFQIALTEGIKEIEYIDAGQQTFPDNHSREHYINMLWRNELSAKHALQVQAYTSRHRVRQNWTTCAPRVTLLPETFAMWQSNRNYAQSILYGKRPSGGTTQDEYLAQSLLSTLQKLGSSAGELICGDVNQNLVESRHDIELQDTFVFSDRLRIVNGIGIRHDMENSQTFLNGQVTNNSYRLFSNLEYKPSHFVSLNVGGFFEKNQLANSAFSPRVASNFHINENHTVRFLISKGTRMPDIKEQRAHWTYTATNLSTGQNSLIFYQSAISPGNLRNEQITSTEIGYLGNFPQYGVLFDAKVYQDKLTNLISEKLELAEFLPTNKNYVRLRGAELQLNYEPNKYWTGYLAYAYMHNDQASLPLEQTQYSKHTGAIGITHLLSNDWRLSIAHYGYGVNGIGQSFYGRTDLTLAKIFLLNKNNRLTASISARRLTNKTTQLFESYAVKEESILKDRMQYYFTAKLEF